MTSHGRNELATNVDEEVRYSNRVLSQAEGLSLNFYTINFTRYICADVHISPEGQRIFNHCLSSVPRLICADDKLQFGYGDRHLLRNIGVQLYEYEHLLLAAALGEFFSEDYVAAVFSALGDCFEDDQRPKPRLSSLRGFACATNGFLSLSQFPLVVDDRIRLNPYPDQDHGMPHISTTNEAIPLDKVAGALRMLGRLRKGEISEVTIAGGDIIGWFAAYIQMFLGIEVALLDHHGNELYCSGNRETPVKLIFLPCETVQTENESHMIWLKEKIDPVVQNTSIPPILTGRVTGDSLFAKIFGRAFHLLDQTEAKVFGNALGGSARMSELVAKDDTIGRDIISEENRLDKGSWGLGLIQTWTNWFPELRHLQGRMERGLRQDMDGATRLCNESIAHLEAHCDCFICSTAPGSGEDSTNLPKYDFCIPSMMETIIMLGLSLSRVILAPDLFPSRAGVLCLYKAQAQKRLDVKKRQLTGDERHKVMFGQDWNSTYPRRLVNLITMFSGSRPTQDLPDNLMALSHEGMCAYVLRLQRGDKSAPRDDDSHVRVVMGQINWRQKTYGRLCLGPVRPAVDIKDGWESMRCDHFEQPLYLK